MMKPGPTKALELWHHMVANRKTDLLAELVHPDAVFRSPMAHNPYQGGMVLALALSTVIDVFEDFTYQRQFVSDDGLNVTLEFSARIGDRQLKGVDLIRFDDNGKIREFEVMVRPMSGLAALGEEMGKRIGAQMKGFGS